MRIPIISIGVLILQCCFIATNAKTSRVLRYNGTSGGTSQMIKSNKLSWETFVADDPKQMEFAVEATKFHTEQDTRYPIYVCRVTVEGGVFVVGHTFSISSKTRCVVVLSMKDVRNTGVFEVLLNNGDAAELTWVKWKKTSPAIPIGAVSASSDPLVARRNLVARRKAILDDSHEHHGMDYYVGQCSKIEIGRIFVAANFAEPVIPIQEFGDVEVLIEAEPKRYELHDIEKNENRTSSHRDSRTLGYAILTNSGEYSNTVETVIAYHYPKTIYWNTSAAVAGLPTKVYENAKSPPVDLGPTGFGTEINEYKTEYKIVRADLEPGTSMNVTLKGNYTKLEGPYKAKLKSYNDLYSKTRTIEGNFLIQDMLDVEIEYGPIYWQHNFTLIPTTTDEVIAEEIIRRVICSIALCDIF